MRQRGKGEAESDLALLRPLHRNRCAAIGARPASVAKAIAKAKPCLAAAKLTGRADGFGRARRTLAQIEPAAERPARQLPPDPEGLPLPRLGVRGGCKRKPQRPAGRGDRARNTARRRRQQPRHQREAETVAIGAQRAISGLIRGFGGRVRQAIRCRSESGWRDCPRARRGIVLAEETAWRSRFFRDEGQRRGPWHSVVGGNGGAGFHAITTRIRTHPPTHRSKNRSAGASRRALMRRAIIAPSSAQRRPPEWLRFRRGRSCPTPPGPTAACANRGESRAAPPAWQ